MYLSIWDMAQVHVQVTGEEIHYFNVNLIQAPD